MRRADVLLAASAPDGLVVLTRERPDVLLADMEMPGKDSYAFRWANSAAARASLSPRNLKGEYKAKDTKPAIQRQAPPS